MDKSREEIEPVRFNFLTGRGRYFVITDKTGCPSAEFRRRPGKGVIVNDPRNSSGDLSGR
jgi:hypothetical protein